MKLYVYQRNAITKCIIINRVHRGWDDDTNQRPAPIKSTLSNCLKALMKLHFHQCSTGRKCIITNGSNRRWYIINAAQRTAILECINVNGCDRGGDDDIKQCSAILECPIFNRLKAIAKHNFYQSSTSKKCTITNGDD
jgi:hypothetical protein